jgi:hypothetical protein
MRGLLAFRGSSNKRHTAWGTIRDWLVNWKITHLSLRPCLRHRATRQHLPGCPPLYGTVPRSHITITLPQTSSWSENTLYVHSGGNGFEFIPLKRPLLTQIICDFPQYFNANTFIDRSRSCGMWRRIVLWTGSKSNQSNLSVFLVGLISWLIIKTLKRYTVSSSVTSLNFYKVIRRHILEIVLMGISDPPSFKLTWKYADSSGVSYVWFKFTQTFWELQCGLQALPLKLRELGGILFYFQNVNLKIILLR